jgi:hypothetical protein
MRDCITLSDSREHICNFDSIFKNNSSIHSFGLENEQGTEINHEVPCQ